MADQLTARQKRAIMRRAGGCCEYCRSPARFSSSPFAMEHIIPRARGGYTTLANLAFSCQGCNNFKYAHTRATDPVTGRQVLLYHPRKQRWRDHFAWNSDFTRIE